MIIVFSKKTKISLTPLPSLPPTIYPTPTVPPPTNFLHPTYAGPTLSKRRVPIYPLNQYGREHFFSPN